MFTVVFGNIAEISTDGQPKVLFYLSGYILWSYFADCFKIISDTFITNKSIFGKVYFPRIVMPLSTVLSNLVKFGIQLGLFVSIYIYFLFDGYELQWDESLLLLPILVLMAGGLSIGFGMIASSLTVKYRDITFLITFGIQLLMYGTPVIYPLSEVSEKYPEFEIFILANPMSAIIESLPVHIIKIRQFGLGQPALQSDCYFCYSICRDDYFQPYRKNLYRYRMSDLALQIENLGKQYRLGVIGTGTLSHDLNRWWYRVRGKQDPYLKVGEVNDRAAKGQSDYVWALRHIDMDVQKGEIVGVIGSNGAGKIYLAENFVPRDFPLGRCVQGQRPNCKSLGGGNGIPRRIDRSGKYLSQWGHTWNDQTRNHFET